MPVCYFLVCFSLQTFLAAGYSLQKIQKIQNKKFSISLFDWHQKLNFGNLGILFPLKNSLSIVSKPCIDLTQTLTLISCYHNATFILLCFNYLYVLIVMSSFVFRLGKISSAVNVTSEFLTIISHKNFSKFCQFPYVNYIQSVGFHFGRGGGGVGGNTKTGVKKNKKE